MYTIYWEPSTDNDIQYYIVQSSSLPRGPWGELVQIPHVLNGPNYLPDSGSFFYEHDTFAIYWYRIIGVDSLNQQSAPSDPFVAQNLPPVFYPGLTPFGVFDLDPDFQNEANYIVDFTGRKLGAPVMEVHLSASQVYAAFEEACLEYSAMVNSYQAKSALTQFLGSPTGTLSGSENKYPSRNLAMQLAMADAYAAEANVNSSQPLLTGTIVLMPGQQTYDLPALLSASGQFTGSGRIRVREIYHKSPMQAYRFFGTTSGLNYLNNQFKFESFTPETLFYLLPVWEDILRGMQFKTSNTVRRSNYSYEMHNNKLNIYPMPSDARALHFTFTVDPNPTDPSAGAGATYGGVSNLSNIPFGNIVYSSLNSISRNWVRRMAFELSKEIEGQIRSKIATIPIPNGDLTLNGPELISDARANQESLRNELKEILEETTYAKLMEREMQMAQSLHETFKQVPMGIYIG
jgi:hypothetical protein